MKKLLILAIALGAGWHFYNNPGEVELGEGVLAPEQPVQHNLKAPRITDKNGYQLTEVALFEVKAKVLARENYRVGREADLSPTDLTLGWGPMSDEAVLSEIDISQSNRFYYWRVEQFPIPRKAIETNSANMHIIPADDEVATQLRQIRKGEIVALSGSLIDADASDGWRWRTSRTRNDTGNGACELFLVKSIEIDPL